MLAPLLNAIRSDVDRQIGWAKVEVRRQTRYSVWIVALACVAALAALGAIVVGLIALYLWLFTHVGPFVALAIIGGGLLLLALMLFTLVLMWRRPMPTSRPLLQTRPTALLGMVRQSSHDDGIAGSEQILKLAAGTMRHGSRSAVLGILVLAAVVGLVAGRRL